MAESQSKTAVTDQMLDSDLLAAFLGQHASIHYDRHTWVDPTGTCRIRVVTLSHIRSLIQSRTYVGIESSCLSTLQTTSLNGSKTFGRVGQFDLIPDLTSLRVCGYASGHAAAMCSFGKAGEVLDMSPRRTLQTAVQKLARKKLSVILGFELEMLLQDKCSTQTATPSFGHVWSSSRSISGQRLKILEDIVEALQLADISVRQFHSEGVPEQYEVTTDPLYALAAVDAWVHSRETVYNVCESNGFRASFHPKPFKDAGGTGAHVHFSLSDITVEKSFIAGVLLHLPAICAFGMPTVVSYERVADSKWTCGTWVAWGTQNRETPLRKVSPGHWELRCLDATGNMYMSMAAVLVAGLHGVEDGMELQLKDCLRKFSESSRVRVSVI